MQKKAFSVMELLVASIIIGVIIVVGIQSAKKATETYDNYFYAAYDILSKAVYNAYLESGGGDNIFANSQTLCTRLVSYINTTQDNCNNLIGNANDITRDNPSFTAVNGMKFYVGNNNRALNNGGDIGMRNSTIIGGVIHAFNGLPNYLGRIIAVDLNGDKGPNTHIFDGATLPDIVFFMIINVGNGSAVPIGRPDIDKRYFQVRVILPDSQYEEYINPTTGNPAIRITDRAVRLQPFEEDGTEKPIDEANPMINKTPPMTFHQARLFAWGDDTVDTWDTHEGFYSTQPMSYASLLANHMPTSRIVCGALEDEAERSACHGVNSQDHNVKAMIWQNYIGAQMPEGMGDQPWIYYVNNNHFDNFVMTAGPHRSLPFNVSRARLDYGCTPNNSECYIVPLRN